MSCELCLGHYWYWTDYTNLFRLRACSYNIHVGPRNPITGVALAMLDSTGSAIKGFGEIGSSISWNFDKASTREENDHSGTRELGLS